MALKYRKFTRGTTHNPKRQKGLIGEVETGGKWERGTAEHNQDNQTGNKTQDTRGTGEDTQKVRQEEELLSELQQSQNRK